MCVSVRVGLCMCACLRVCVCLCACVLHLQSPVDVVTGGMSPIRDMDRLLQEMDINRLRAVVFRDIVSLQNFDKD